MVNCSRTFSISEDDRMRIIHYKGATKGFELLTCAGFRRGFFFACFGMERR